MLLEMVLFAIGMASVTMAFILRLKEQRHVEGYDSKIASDFVERNIKQDHAVDSFAEQECKEILHISKIFVIKCPTKIPKHSKVRVKLTAN